MNEAIVAALLAAAVLLAVIGVGLLTSLPWALITSAPLLAAWTVIVIRQIPEPPASPATAETT